MQKRKDVFIDDFWEFHSASPKAIILKMANKSIDEFDDIGSIVSKICIDKNVDLFVIFPTGKDIPEGFAWQYVRAIK